MIISPFREQVFYLNYFRQLGGGGQRFFLSLLLFENSQLKVVNITERLFWGGKLFPSTFTHYSLDKSSSLALPIIPCVPTISFVLFKQV